MLTSPALRRPAAVLLTAVAMLPAARFVARGDFPQPRLAAIHPCGGARGTELEVTVVGSDLDDLERLEFFHPGIRTAAILPSPTEFDPEPRPLPGRLRLAIAADVPPGLYDAVAVGRFGASNPRPFMVGTGPEMLRSETGDTPEKAVELPADIAVSGRVPANKADHFAVSLAAGGRLRAEVWARRLDSRLDAVLELLGPDGDVVARSGRPREEDAVVDFTAAVAGRHVLRLRDRFVRGGDDFFYRLLLSSGPTVEAVFPPVVETGAGTVRLTAIGRGLPDAALSAVDDSPPGLAEREVFAQPGGVAADAMARRVWRLLAPRDAATTLVDLRGDLLDALPVPPAALAASLPPTVEQEPNDTASEAMPLTLPAVVAGRANPRGDRDWFSFQAKAGETWVFDLFSRRLGMPTDMALLVRRVVPPGSGQPPPAAEEADAAVADDGPQEFPPPYAAVARDPTLLFAPPADGTYLLQVRELAVDSLTGVDRSWVLEARRPEPGFELVAMLGRPDRVDRTRTTRGVPVLAGGGSTPVEVLVVRKDGFAGEVVLEARGLPDGVTAPATIVPAAATAAAVVLTAAAGTPAGVVAFEIVGRGRTAEGEVLERTARVAALRWDVGNRNQPVFLRETRSLPLAVTLETAPMSVRPTQEKVWEVQRGGRVEVPLAVVRREAARGAVTLTAAAGLSAPLGVTAVTIEEQADAAAVAIEVGSDTPPGQHVVLLTGSIKASFVRNPQAVERLAADAERIAALVDERKGEAAAARERLETAEAALAERPAEAGLVAARDQARKEVADAEAKARAAEQEHARRDRTATTAATAAAAKDIDVPVVVPPITILVADAQPPPAPAPPPAREPPKS